MSTPRVDSVTIWLQIDDYWVQYAQTRKRFGCDLNNLKSLNYLEKNMKGEQDRPLQRRSTSPISRVSSGGSKVFEMLEEGYLRMKNGIYYGQYNWKRSPEGTGCFLWNTMDMYMGIYPLTIRRVPQQPV